MSELLDCRSCRRLARHLDKLRVEHPDWHNRPVPSIGPPDARLLILGLAPGRLGANRTGVPFIGDKSADWLCTRLREAGCLDADDSPRGIRISNAVKCLPPKNLPTTTEIKRCVKKLTQHELDAPNVVLLWVGLLTTPSFARSTEAQEHRFGHGLVHELDSCDGGQLIHPHEYANRPLSPGQFDDALRTAIPYEIRLNHRQKSSTRSSQP